jgi:hypothetical protein
MRAIYTLYILISLSLPAFSQQKTNVLVMSNKEGKLFVDAVEFSPIKANEATKVILDEGEHIIQVKTQSETQSKTINCTDGKQKVITFEFSSLEPAPAVNNSKFQIVADTELDLPGSLSQQGWLNKYYAFDEGDEISFSLKVLNKKGTINIYFYSYPDNALVFSKQTEQEVADQKITIPQRGVYRFSFATNHIINRSAKFTIKRYLNSETARVFNTSVRIKYDTTYQEVLNSQVRVYSIRNENNPNRTTVRINLPENTSYWVYWIGVGQESMNAMKSFAEQLSKGAAGLAGNPIYALGFGLISKLPMFNSTATIGYRFSDHSNSVNFLYGRPYSYYTFKEGNAVTTDYSVVKTVSKDVNFCLWNNEKWNGHDVQIKVGAFIIRGTYVPEE